MTQEWEIAEEGWGKVVEAVLGAAGEAGRTHAFLVLLSGDLGAGKTTFAQTLARALGLDQPVRSPTFPIQQRYAIHWKAAPPGGEVNFTTLIHMDAYRLTGIEELRRFGTLDELADPENFFVIEWPEQIPGIEKYPHISIIITEAGDDMRKVTMTGPDGTI